MTVDAEWAQHRRKRCCDGVEGLGRQTHPLGVTGAAGGVGDLAGAGWQRALRLSFHDPRPALQTERAADLFSPCTGQLRKRRRVIRDDAVDAGVTDDMGELRCDEMTRQGHGDGAQAVQRPRDRRPGHAVVGVEPEATA